MRAAAGMEASQVGKSSRASLIGRTACCSWSKDSCRKPFGSPMRRLSPICIRASRPGGIAFASQVPMYLDAILVDEVLTGGLEPRLGNAHLRTLTIMGFPSATHPGILDELNRLAFPYRWSTRAIALDKTDAARVLTRIRRQWFAKRKSIVDRKST